MKRNIFILFTVTFFAFNSFAYDIIGHRTVADVAYNNLSANAKQQMDDLLGIRGLVYFSSWADDMRNDSTYKYSYNWHFQNLQDNITPDSLKLLWENPISQGEYLFYAVQNMIQRLKTNKKDAEALKFLIHFMADLHQPFHLGRLEDRGGNNIQTKWFGQTIRVHQLWDKDLIDLQGFSYSEYSQYLQDKYSITKTFYQQQTLLESIETVYMLRQQLYGYDYNAMKAYTYNFVYKDRLDEMLFRAGIQLAKILNEIY